MLHSRNARMVMAVLVTLSGCSDDSAAPGSADSSPSFATVNGSVTTTKLALPNPRSGWRASAVNDQGAIVGSQLQASGLFSAFVWTPGVARGTVGTANVLVTQGSEAMATGINATGHIVGMSRSTPTGVRNAVLWSPSGSGGYGAPFDLGTAPGVSGGSAWAIGDFQNGNAEVVGSTDYTNEEAAVAWTVTLVNGGVTSQARVLGGLVSGQGSSARSVNASGQVVGYANVSTPTGPHNHAVLWTPSGVGWTILDLLPSSVQSIAWGINAQGYIVGQDGTRAFVRDPSGTVSTLPTLGGPTAAAYGINDAGEISGFAVTSGRQQRAVLWLPNQTGYSVKDLGKLSRGIGYALNEPNGGVTEVVGSGTSRNAESATLWTVR